MKENSQKNTPANESVEQIRKDAEYFGRANACKLHPSNAAYAELYDECIFDL